MFCICNASETEPEALADFRLKDSGDRLAPASASGSKKQSLCVITNFGTRARVVAFSEKCPKIPHLLIVFIQWKLLSQQLGRTTSV